MKIAIIVSTKDPAGMNINQRLLESRKFKETEENFDGHAVYSYLCARLYTTDTDSINCEDIDKRIAEDFDADIFIFATKHKSAAGIKSLSVHSPGNWSKAEHGGKDRRLCIAPASYLKFALLKLDETNQQKNLGFEVIQECTHHGPYLEKPCMFIEIGSDESAWQDKRAGEAIAETLLHMIESEQKGKIPKCRAVFGIGGLHHTPEISKVVRRTEYAAGHTCPKYMLEHLDEGMIRQALEKTAEKVELVVLDWKGLKENKQKVLDLLKKLGLGYKQSTKMY